MTVRRILAIATMALFVFALLVTPADVDAKGKKKWCVKKLPHLSDWYGSVGNDISNNGYVGGVWIDEDAGAHAAYWHRGKAYDLETEIGLPSGLTDSGVWSINCGGIMGGNAWENVYGFQAAVIWNLKKGTVSNIHPGDEYYASALYGVNARGTAAGFVVAPDEIVDETSLGYKYVPWVWEKGAAPGNALPLGDYHTGDGLCINSWGVIGGYVADELFIDAFAALWYRDCKGKYRLVDLHEKIVMEDDSIVMSQVWDVGDNGVVVGQCVDEDDVVHAFRWTLLGGLDLLPMKDEERAIAWKASGPYVAGGIGVKTHPDVDWIRASEDATVWVRGKLEVIPDLKDFPVMESSAVNRWGGVVGLGYARDDDDLLYPQGWYARKK